ncbi:MAG: hypothetical protein JZD41_00185, partial [Thermoproteus sp.]|nr:hypothetical protein [Thermoproteus sp.]
MRIVLAVCAMDDEAQSGPIAESTASANNLYYFIISFSQAPNKAFGRRKAAEEELEELGRFLAETG